MKKRLCEARVAKKSKSSDTVSAGSGSVGVDEELEAACLSTSLEEAQEVVEDRDGVARVPPGPHRTLSCQHACVLRTIVGEITPN